MAGLDNRISAGLEAYICDALKDMANKVAKDYGVKIESVNFNWLDRMDGNNTIISVEVRISK